MKMLFTSLRCLQDCSVPRRPIWYVLTNLDDGSGGFIVDDFAHSAHLHADEAE